MQLKLFALSKHDTDNFISGNHKIVRNINRSAILNLVRERHPVSRAALSKLSDLNKSTNIIKGIDPEIVVLGGIITTAWDLIYPEITKEIRSRVFFKLNESRKVFPTSLKERSSLVGAFTLAIKEIFKGYKITI